MEILSFSLFVGLLCASPALGNGLIGFGIEMYAPLCAFSCRAAIEPAMLSCSDMSAHHEGGMMHGGSAMTTPECRAGDTPFLTTLAWCMKSTCADTNIKTWRLEKYWAEKATGDPAVVPKWSYAETLEQVTEPPTQEVGEDTLNFTALVSHETWSANRGTMEKFELVETLHSTYGIIVLVVGFATPIILTLLGKLPFTTGLLDKIKPYIVYPSLIGTYQVRPLPYFLGNAPTIGQTIYIVLLLILNIILTAVGYSTSYPNNLWFASTWQEVMGYVTNRTGVLAFALAPLVILFSGRNNILLWLTNWSHSTYMLLHRWVARIFALQVILHSVTEVILYKNMGEYGAELVQPYWIWGAVGTVAVSIMLIVSNIYFRRWSYEIFLITHIILAVFVIAGSWYHVELLYTRKWGYELWLYAAIAVWFSNRLVRVLRISKTGICHANVTEIGSDIVRVNVEGVRWSMTPGFHAYAYFPSLAPLKPWENHPFSVIPTAMLLSRKHSVTGTESPVPEGSDIEKNKEATQTTIVEHGATDGISLYIKKSQGMTRFLQTHNSLTTLLDGPYPSNPSSAVLKCDRLLLIAGGIGITGVLPWLINHLNVKLCWSVKQSAECLVNDLSPVLENLAEKEVKVGQRLDVSVILTEELQRGWKKIGVVACGPGGLCDDVRALVAKSGREGKGVFELEVDAFSW